MKHIQAVVLLSLGVTILAVSIHGAQAGESDPIDALKACARTNNTEKRVACYEALGKQVLGEEIAAGTTKTAAPVAAAPAVMAGASPAVDEDDKDKPIHGHVRSCQKASDNRYYFILDSGDIWKQSGGRTHRFKDCSFDVTIRKDVFGYKMAIVGDDKTVRVKRHR